MKGWYNANMAGKESITKELLEACRATETHYAMLCEVICVDSPPPGGMPILAQLRAAIAKAEGGK